MTSTLQQMYQELEKCTESLEEDVKQSLQKISETTFSENMVALENSKDYHYKEILNQLKQIKEHIRIIAEHHQSVQLLEKKISRSSIDKNYIKRQVESFQKLGTVNRREHKPVRPRETSSMKLLECWDRMMEEQDGVLPVVKRATNLRKTKKIVSSTVDMFLENAYERSSTEENEDKILESLSEQEEEIDSKPRIVDVVYKKNRNGDVSS